MYRFLEESQLKAYNFKPELNKGVPNFENKEPIMMKGYAKHIEQMEKAKKAKRDKEERMKEVFTTGENWSRDNIITIPKPFNLSHVILLLLIIYKIANFKSKTKERRAK